MENSMYTIPRKVILGFLLTLSAHTALPKTDHTNLAVAGLVGLAAVGGYSYLRHINKEYWDSRLFNALDCRDIGSVKAVLAKGASAQATKEGETTLTYALKNQCKHDIIALLLSNGVTVKEYDHTLTPDQTIQDLVRDRYFEQLWDYRLKVLGATCLVGASTIAYMRMRP